MTTLGKNVKITAPQSVRTQARAVFELLGAKLATPSDRFDVFTLDGGGNIGYEYVADADALTPAQMRSAPWLEIAVADPDKSREALTDIGLERIDYRDKDHAYFVGPAGVVFRLAALAG
jgi:hypothetical protein